MLCAKLGNLQLTINFCVHAIIIPAIMQAKARL